METLAYLHTACTYEEPETVALTVKVDLNLSQLSSQAGLLMLQLFVPVAILAIAGHASALQVGDRGSAVTTLQDRLRSAGYFNRSSTGIYASITANAVRRFQRDQGLTVDGIAGPATQQALRGQSYAASGGNYQTISYSGGLRLGSTGGDVSALQQQLKNLGYDLNVDGVFGSVTDQAVRQFQASNGLVADGIVGSATRSALSNGVNVAYPNPTDPTYPSSGGNSTASIRKRYVVVVPIKSTATLSQVRQYSRGGAFIASSNLGKYVQAGTYDNRGLAEAEATRLRAYKLDAQVRYF